MTTHTARTEPGQPPIYGSIDAVNQSTLKAMRISPAHYQAALQTPVTETDQMRLGSAVHARTLEPGRFDRDFCMYPATYINEKGETKPWHNGAGVCRKWNADAQAAGKTILSSDQYSLAITASRALNLCPELAPLMGGGEAERVLLWTNPDTGVRCKGRADWISNDEVPVLLDIKTMNRAGASSPRSYQTTAWAAGHWFQLAMYQEGLEVETGKVAKLALVTIEMLPPFPVRIYWLSDAGQARAWDEYVECLVRLKECLASGQWPGPDVVHKLDPPPWVMAGEEGVDFGGIEMEVSDGKDS